MTRVLEPELMDDPAQAAAYAQADFAAVNQDFVARLTTRFPELREGHVLDLGCGPGDIPVRLARALPRCRITAVDAAAEMIRLAEAAVRGANLGDRIALRCQRFQDLELTATADAVVSNSLLHHLPDPDELWRHVKRLAAPGAAILVMDLLRPQSPKIARALVDKHAAGEPEVLRRDFYNSLLAACTTGEVAAQLARAGLAGFHIEVPDDRHWLATGRV